MNYANGSAFTNSITYSQRGFGITGEIHRADNMLLLSERERTGKAYIMNYIPTLSKPLMIKYRLLVMIYLLQILIGYQKE